MPTKPTRTPFVWATDATYTNGPAPLIGTSNKLNVPAGVAAEGWTANAVPPAQQQNDLLNLVTLFTVWASEGDFTALEEARIVEADATGKVFAPILEVGGHSTLTDSALLVTGPATGFAASATVTDGGRGATGLLVSAGNTGTGTPAAVVQNSGNDGTALQAGTAASTGLAVQALGADTVLSSTVTGGGTGTAGLFTTNATAGSFAVDAVGSGESNQTVLRATASPGSDGSCEAILGRSSGGATGVYGESTGGFGVVAESGGTKGPLLVTPSATPSEIDQGALFAETSLVVGRLRAGLRGAWRYLMDTLAPVQAPVSDTDTTSTGVGGVSPTETASAEFQALGSGGTARGTLVLWDLLLVEIGTPGSSTAAVRLKSEDVVGGGSVVTHYSATLVGQALAANGNFSGHKLVLPPNLSNRKYYLEVEQLTGTPGTLNVVEANVLVWGELA